MSDWYEKWEKHFDEEMEKQKDLPKGMVKGKIFKINVADGYAYYEIVRVNKKSVNIKWRKDLCLDEYQYYAWGAGGTFERDLIEHLIVSDERMAEILSG
jgi:hypothetical protein